MQDLPAQKPDKTQDNQGASARYLALIHRLKEQLATVAKPFGKDKSAAKKAVDKPTWAERFKLLSYSQWLYFLSFIYLITAFDQGDWNDADILLVGALAGIGLAREMWHIFHTIWNTTLGKSIFLVLYAATANFALAIAALKVNSIAGVEPTPLRFTLGFTTLIMLPMWIFVASVLFATLLLMAGVIWQVISIPLRLLRIKVPVHWEDRSFITISMLLRLILIPVVISALYLAIRPYAEQVYVFSAPLEVKRSRLDWEQSKELAALSEEEREEAIADLEEAGLIKVDTFQAQDEEQDTEQVHVVDRMIAGFIYQFETYPHSSCKKEENQRVLTINEYSMLVAEKDESPLGYTFTVQACEPFYPESTQANE